MPATPIGSSAAAPDLHRRRSSSALAIASHLALWPGLYIVGAVACLAQISGASFGFSPRAWLAACGFAFTTAAAVYLLDRVKLRDAWLKPADALAHPRRYAFIAAHTRALRIVIAVLLIVAACFGAWLFKWAAILPLVAGAGVLLYAGRPRAVRPRPKDILILKNVYVALGITGFALLIVIFAAYPDADFTKLRRSLSLRWSPLSIGCAYLFLRVLADSILCDLDDELADRRYGTDTLPNQLGRDRAWTIALAIYGAGAIALAFAAVPFPLSSPRLAWAVLSVVSFLTLRIAAPARIRDWVDARLPFEAAMIGAAFAILASLPRITTVTGP